MIKKLILLILLCTSVLAFSQQKSYSFTLEEAIQFALDSNYTALNARREIAKAIKKKWETTATGLPQIKGTVSYNNNLKQPVTLIPSEFFGGSPVRSLL